MRGRVNDGLSTMVPSVISLLLLLLLCIQSYDNTRARNGASEAAAMIDCTIVCILWGEMAAFHPVISRLLLVEATPVG